MVSANYQWAGVIMILDGGPFFFFFWPWVSHVTILKKWIMVCEIFGSV